ncbi:ferrous iron transport protein B [Petroclostridium sp. X23]|uniref:ferrous iron transport protein B n=1 Tax=Petroclostridium sp. X23 TaxID=3045146 RepID=UPI0024AD6411|nr:ferrous iron transport protein B [Petroclostridium sp. X23]WHH58872.1 ferrous iron transport protein B [Petroclostridium sp. X23]
MSTCHSNVIAKDVDMNSKKLVLVGNPNVGKSVFFNSLTGLYVDVSNYPGTTVDISTGKYNDYTVIDTPGVYGVSSFNDEERVARDVIISADMIINVVDAVHLQRDLFLTQQLIDMGKKIIVAFNMMDEVKAMGMNIDIDKLSSLLGVPVIPTIALKGQGLDEVKRKIPSASLGNKTEGIEDLLTQYKNKVQQEAEALLVLEDDPNILSRNGVGETGFRESVYKKRRERVDDIVSQAVSELNKGASFRTKLGRYMLRPLTGIPILLIAMGVMYEFIGVFVAQTVVGITEETIMIGIYQPFITSIIENFIQKQSFLGQVLIGEFGLLTMTPVYVLGLLLPLVAGFYLLLSIMEDSGYLPRVAALVDRVLTGVGLNGRAIIPIILGFGCITMATITTRLLGTKRERVIATVLLGLTIPCSAQLGVIIGLIAPLGVEYLLIYTVVILTVFALSGAVLNKVLPGESSDLLIDLPPLRIPRLTNVLKKTYTKSKGFMFEATPLFALGALLISIMQYTGALVWLQDAIYPITVGWLKLPKEATTALVMGIVRRDFGAAGLSDLAMSPAQILVSLVVITLFVPCIASIIVIFKERTKTEAALIWFGSFIVAFVVGGILGQIMI